MSAAPKRPIEGALVSTFDYMVLTEQDQLARIPEEIAADLHIYMVCRRPRIGVVPDSLKLSADSCELTFTAQHGPNLRQINVKCRNVFEETALRLESDWPHGDFRLVTADDTALAWGRSALLLSLLGHHDEDLDLEVLYIGQAYGVGGNRSAPERLASHETLQAIYGEAVRRSPDNDVFLLLLSLADPYGLIMLSPVSSDNDDLMERFTTLTSPVTEQQRIKFTEAALIRYFAPPYNKEYKNTFPSPAHKTYAECYDLDLNLVAFELDTSETLNLRLWSQVAKRSWWHARDFALHDPAERPNMFDFRPDP